MTEEGPGSTQPPTAASDEPNGAASSGPQKSSLVPRVITGLIGAAIAVGLILSLQPYIAFMVWLAVFSWAAAEFVHLARHFAPTAPLGGLWLWIPATAFAGFFIVRPPGSVGEPVALVAAAFIPVAVAAIGCLLSSDNMRDAAIGMGLTAFAIPYFAIPSVAIYKLHLIDRWVVFLLLAIVALGDTAAYFIGRSFGRHALAPSISPKKTWEGSVAGFAAAVCATALWSHWRLGEIRPTLLALAAITAVAAQLGDLVESVMKRGAGVKDSSHVLPGHGGFYDRLDAMLLAAPTFTLGLLLLGFELVVKTP